MKRFLPIVVFVFLQAACAQGIRLGPEPTDGNQGPQTPFVNFTPAAGTVSSAKYTLFIRTGTNLFQGGTTHGKKISLEDPLMKAGESKVLNKIKSQKR